MRLLGTSGTTVFFAFAALTWWSAAGFPQETEAAVQQEPLETEIPGIEGSVGNLSTVPPKAAHENDKIAAHLSALEEEQERRLDLLETRFTALESQVKALEASYHDATHMQNASHLANFPPELHGPLRQLHKQHEEQVQRVKQQQGELNHTIANLHRQVSHITELHNMPRRLRKIADLIVANRWHEVMRQWEFVENNLLDEGDAEPYQLLAEHLRTVIAHVAAGRGSDEERMQRLFALFKFVHRLHEREHEYTIAYPTLVDELLSDSDLFNGSEIFVLAQFLKQQLRWSNRARSALPHLPKLVSLGPQLKLALISQTKQARETAVDQRITEVLRNDSRLNFFEVHIKGDMIKKKRDRPLSFRFPVMASPFGSYSPETSGSWQVVYNETGHFMFKNVENEAFLHVPTESDFLRTKVDDEISKAFNLYLLDDFTIGVESADFKRPIIAVECEGGATCFILRGGGGHTRHNWTGSRFALFPLAEPYDPSVNFFV